jgi:hypothetical protein
MMTGEYQYFAAFHVDEAIPWALLRHRWGVGEPVSRYVPQRKAYVPFREHRDYIAFGMSSDANMTDEISAAQAKVLEGQVEDVDQSVLDIFEIK